MESEKTKEMKEGRKSLTERREKRRIKVMKEKAKWRKKEEITKGKYW